jgi:3-oxoacyl-(acyl-carrier-protein) synthase
MKKTAEPSTFTDDQFSPVITGAGWVTPFGTDLKALERLLEGTNNGQSPDCLPELDFQQMTGVKNKRTKRLDPLSKTASIAAYMAFTDSKLLTENIKPGRGAVVSGSSMGASLSINTFTNQLFGDGPNSVDPNVFPPTSHNVAGGHISIQFNMSGPLIHFASGKLSSHMAIIYGADLINLGRADVVICGGWEELSPELNRQLIMTNEPSLIPGASLFILESKTHAKAREARIIAEIYPRLSAICQKESENGRPVPSEFLPSKLEQETYGYSGALALAVALSVKNNERFTIEGINNTEAMSFVVEMK